MNYNLHCCRSWSLCSLSCAINLFIVEDAKPRKDLTEALNEYILVKIIGDSLPNIEHRLSSRNFRHARDFSDRHMLRHYLEDRHELFSRNEANPSSIAGSPFLRLIEDVEDFLLDYVHSSSQIACNKPLWVMFVNSDCLHDATALSGDLRGPPIDGSARSVQSPWLMSLVSDINIPSLTGSLRLTLSTILISDSHCA